MKSLTLGSIALATVLSSTIALSESFVNAYDKPTEVVNNIANNIIVGNYSFMTEKANELIHTAQNLQKETNIANLRKAQAAWRNVRIGFEVAEAHLFGPVVSLGVDPALDSWPLDTEQMAFSANIAKTLSGEDLNKFVSSLNENVTGFHAVEYVLFGEENNKKAEDFTQEELDYLVLLTNLIQEKASQLQTAWLEGLEEEEQSYISLLITSDQGNDIYKNTLSAIEEYVAGMIVIIDEVGTAKLIDPMGDSIATANPMLVESQYSWNSTTDFFWNIAGVWQIWHGDSILTGTEGAGIRDIISTSDEALAQKIDTQINAALESIVTISYNQYESGNAIFKNKGDIISLVQLIDTDSAESAFRNQISLVSGRKNVGKAEAALDTLFNTLSEEVLPKL